jgi:Ca2+-binding EF-hand superfamily protein
VVGLKSFLALLRLSFQPSMVETNPPDEKETLMYRKLQPTGATLISAIAMLGFTAVVTIANAAEGPAAKKFQAVDKNGDGKISREEASAYPNLAKYFDQIDTNKDGMLTGDEVRAHHAKAMAAKLKALDKDGDGRISRAEADAKAPRLAKNFDRLDTNKDGFISQDEMAAARKSYKSTQ